jgi:hypothetical protein
LLVICGVVATLVAGAVAFAANGARPTWTSTTGQAETGPSGGPQSTSQWRGEESAQPSSSGSGSPTSSASPKPRRDGGSGPGKPAGPQAAGACSAVSDRLVPQCGAWLGMWPRTRADGTQTNDLVGNVASLEQRLGRRLSLVSRYYGWGQMPPDATDQKLRDTGHTMLIDLRARNFSTNQYVQWRDIANGSHDEYLRSVGDRLRAFGSKVFFSFNQEPEMELQKGTQVAGTAQDFAAAYRHVHDVIASRGAKNVVWVWWVMGWTGAVKWYPDLYPGDRYVDWVSYDPYDFNQCHNTGQKTAKDAVQPFLTWLDGSGIAKGKPVMLSEFGSNGADRGAWYRDLGQTVKQIPRIKGIVSFNSTVAGCDTRVTTSADNWQGFASIAHDPHFSVTLAR